VLLVESDLQIRLEKVARGKIWDSLGAVLPGNAEMTPRCGDTFGELSSYCRNSFVVIHAYNIYMYNYTGTQYISCSLEAVESVNYNTKMFTFKLPGASRMIVPTGHHVSIKSKDQQGMYVITGL